MGVSVEVRCTCDICFEEIDRQVWAMSPNPELPMVRPDLKQNTYMWHGIYNTLCDECAGPIILALKFVGANKKEQTDG